MARAVLTDGRSQAPSFAPGDRVFLDYGVAAEPWHERRLLAWVGAGDWVVQTPDGDVYVEEIACPPLSGVRAVPADGSLPIGLGAASGNPVYRFSRPLAAGVLERLTAEGKQVAELARVADPVRYPLVLPPAERDPLPRFRIMGKKDATALAGTSGVGVAGAPPFGAPPGLDPPLEPVGTEWVVVDPDAVPGALGVGAVLPSTEVIFRVGERGVAGNGAGGGLLVCRVDAGQGPALLDTWGHALVPTPRESPVVSDARTLGIQRGGSGERFRPFPSVADTCEAVEFSDWPLVGPRTVKYYITEIARTGMGPVARHSQWKHENNLRDDDQLCLSHEVLSEALELLGCVDQFDLANSAGVESMVRQLQFIENEVRKKTEAARPHDASEYYLGRPKKVGGAIHAPDLSRFIADQSARDSAILKETRKAAEERTLLRAAAKKGPGPKKAGDG